MIEEIEMDARELAARANGDVCIECGNAAIGTCENCNAPICDDHEEGIYDDVYTCKDNAACEARCKANEEAKR